MPRNRAFQFAWNSEIDLGGSGGNAISAVDAARQATTGEEIINRLRTQPGVVLADQVGLGKTFVALAVAASVAMSTGKKNPVIVMVPPALKLKWPQEWETFEKNCLPRGHGLRATSVTVDNPADFLKLFDDSNYHIAFVAHGALTRQVGDPFTRLAIIRSAFHSLKNVKRQRAAFARWASRLLDSKFDEATTTKLLDSPIDQWRDIWNKRKPNYQLSDDPVFLRLPSMIKDSGASLQSLRHELRALPVNNTSSIKQRLQAARPSLMTAIQDVWNSAIGHAAISSPLLILDEAHHVRHNTRVAGLFTTPEAQGDAEELRAGGALAGKFDRMLFLTATPFQLGHRELIHVLERFGGINWDRAADLKEFRAQLATLSSTLDRFQESAHRFETAWGRLAESDMEGLPDHWWESHVPLSESAAGRILSAKLAALSLNSDCETTQTLLRPWVIRHVRDDRHHRRAIKPGDAIRPSGDPDVGLAISPDAIFPFLIAARARTVVADRRLTGPAARANFAEGLASSFEAYRFTRNSRDGIDGDEEQTAPAEDADLQWYLNWIEKTLPRHAALGAPLHPKVAATVERTVDAWSAGEKVLIFCYYRETGKALRREVSTAIEKRLFDRAADYLGMDRTDVSGIADRLKRIGINTLDSESSSRKEIDGQLLRMCRETGLDAEESELFADVVRGFLRTESFVVRHVLPFGQDGQALVRALGESDDGIEPLRPRLDRFLRRLAGLPDERRRHTLEALKEFKTGRTMTKVHEAEGRLAKTMVLPNVRLANGGVKQDTRDVLVTAFNMPFFPEVLIASPVLGEGVDLHWECRTVIHHDLDWNPSALEQRNGRLDRIGSRSEVVDRPIEIYEPYTTGLQDEKTYRVVTDRARWFSVVMGEKEDLSESGTDRISERVEIPQALADSLTLDLRVYRAP